MNARACRLALVLMLAGTPILERTHAQTSPARAPAKPIVCLGSSRYRHPSAIEHADLSPDGRTLFTLSYKGVYVWDLQTGIGRFLFADERLRNALRLSPDGKQLVSISGDDVAIWDTETGKEIKRFDDSFSALTAAFDPDRNGVVIFRENQIEHRALDKGMYRIGETAPYCAPVFSPDRKWFVAASPGKPLRALVVYNARTLKRKAVLAVGAAGFGPHHGGSEMVRAGFAPGGDRLAVPGGDGAIRLWDIATAKEVRILKAKPEKAEKGEREYRFLLFSTDGKWLFVGTESGTIRRWDVESGEELPSLRSHHQGITSLHLTGDGKQLASTDEVGMIRRWEAVTGKEIAPPDGYSGSLHARLSADGRWALLLDSTGRMDVWELNTGRLRWRVRPSAKVAIDTSWVEPLFGFLVDGERVFLAEQNGKITIWDSAGDKPVASIELKEYDYTDHGKRLRFCVAAPDGRSFVVNRGRRRLARIDAETGEDIWESPEFPPRTICYTPVFSPDGKVVFLGTATSEDKPYTELRGRLELVRLAAATGKVVDRKQVPSATTGDLNWFEQPRITPDGRTLLITYGFSEISIADAASNKIQHRHALILDSCTLSPDGKWVVGFGLESLQVHGTATGKELYRLLIGKQTVQSLYVLPNGQHVLATGKGGLACVWELRIPSSPANRQDR